MPTWQSLRLRAGNALRLLRLRDLKLSRQSCPLCGGRWLLRLQRSEHGIRCLRCGGGPVQMALADALLRHVPDLSRCHVYELSSRGPLYQFLQHRAGQLSCSEYFDDVEPGAWRGAVQCQNVERLSYADASFDLCTSLDVFEHVADDRAGFAQLYRVLRPGGCTLFTVPLHDSPHTVERVRQHDGQLQYLLPPEYHGDQLRGAGAVLSWRDYGDDILQRLQQAGFDASFDTLSRQRHLGFGRVVVVARKPE